MPWITRATDDDADVAQPLSVARIAWDPAAHARR